MAPWLADSTGQTSIRIGIQKLRLSFYGLFTLGSTTREIAYVGPESGPYTLANYGHIRNAPQLKDVSDNLLVYVARWHGPWPSPRGLLN